MKKAYFWLTQNSPKLYKLNNQQQITVLVLNLNPG